MREQSVKILERLLGAVTEIRVGTALCTQSKGCGWVLQGPAEGAPHPHSCDLWVAGGYEREDPIAPGCGVPQL